MTNLLFTSLEVGRNLIHNCMHCPCHKILQSVEDLEHFYNCSKSICSSSFQRKGLIMRKTILLYISFYDLLYEICFIFVQELSARKCQVQRWLFPPTEDKPPPPPSHQPQTDPDPDLENTPTPQTLAENRLCTPTVVRAAQCFRNITYQFILPNIQSYNMSIGDLIRFIKVVSVDS